MPKNCTEWNESNEGAERLLVETKLSEETLEYLYYSDVEFKMSWRIAEVVIKNESSETSRRRL